MTKKSVSKKSSSRASKKVTVSTIKSVVNKVSSKKTTVSAEARRLGIPVGTLQRLVLSYKKENGLPVRSYTKSSSIVSSSTSSSSSYEGSSSSSSSSSILSRISNFFSSIFS